MSDLWNSPHLILLLLVVPLTGLLLKSAVHGAAVVRAHVLARKVIRTSCDVGIHLHDLALADGFRNRLLLIQRAISEECSLRYWRLIRLTRDAVENGLPHAEAELIIANLERLRDANAPSSEGTTFSGSTFPDGHPLLVRYPVEIRAFNARMRTLLVHWRWTCDWLRYARDRHAPRS